MCDDWSCFEFCSRNDVPNISGVYLLMNDIELVYIGQSNNIRNRVGNHHNNLNCVMFLGDEPLDVDTFDSLYYLECDYKPERKSYEDMFKEDYSPKLNDYNIERDYLKPKMVEERERRAFMEQGINPDELSRKWKYL